MTISVKNKIRAGTGFLFLLVLLAGGVGMYYMTRIKNDAQVILANNYESLAYCQKIETILNSGKKEQPSIDSINKFVALQEVNVTETGELEATKSLRDHLNNWKVDFNKESENQLRIDLNRISTINLLAIEKKNSTALETAERGNTYLSFMIAAIFLISISFLYNFPSIVTDPIQEFREGILQVGVKNYSHRIRIESEDEFGQMADSFNSMAERLEYFENSNLNKIMFEKSRAESVIQSLKDATIGIDTNGKLLFANKQAVELLGISADQIVGIDADELASKNDLFKFLLQDEIVSPFKIIVNNHENYFIRELIEMSQEENKGSRIIVFKNITSFKELDLAKTNFLATVSHELKTPLASSDFGLKLLEDERVGSLKAEQAEIVSNLRKDNQRMLRILSELLNMSQIESGKIELKLAPFNIKTLFQGVLSGMVSLVKEKQLSIKEEFSDPDLRCIGDIEKTGWVLNNLLGNAIKFSPESAIVTVRVEAKNEEVVVSVTDQGPGIPEEYLQQLFDRYYKVPGNSIQGTGLGLAICRELIEGMKGRIYAESKPGNGSTFFVVLPMPGDITTAI